MEVVAAQDVVLEGYRRRRVSLLQELNSSIPSQCENRPPGKHQLALTACRAIPLRYLAEELRGVKRPCAPPHARSAPGSCLIPRRSRLSIVNSRPKATSYAPVLTA